MNSRTIASIATNLEIMKKAFKVSVTYRINTIFEVLSIAFGFYIQICVWTALYGAREMLNGITLSDMVSYTLVSTFVSSLSYSGIALKIANQVKEGTIGNELVRPVKYKNIIMYHEIGGNMFHSVCIMLPVVILFGFIFQIKLPESTLRFLLFLISVSLGVTLIYGLNFIYGILAFWLKTSEYVNFISRALMTLFAGRFVPLWFYPNVLFQISQVLPFRFITFEPMQIFLGKVDIQGSLYIIGLQIVWVAILTVVQGLMWKAVQKHLVIQGG